MMLNAPTQSVILERACALRGSSVCNKTSGFPKFAFSKFENDGIRYLTF